MTDTPDDTTPAEAELPADFDDNIGATAAEAVHRWKYGNDRELPTAADIDIAYAVLTATYRLIAARAAADQLQADIQLATERGAVVPAEWFELNIPVPFTPFADLLTAQETM